MSHVFFHQKFASLTLGFEKGENEADLYQELDQYSMPECDYLVVNVSPYRNYELGTHVLAAWNVFSEFDYSAHQLKRKEVQSYFSVSKSYRLYCIRHE